MHKRTKATRISQETANRVANRDKYCCLFCRENYQTLNKNRANLECNVFDIAHFIPRSKGGLGIEENLVFLCRYHHSLMDNGNFGLRQEMLEKVEEYLKRKYPDWEKERLTYKKWQ